MEHVEGGSKRLAEVMQQFLAKANADPRLGGVQTLWRATSPQLYVDVYREKAKGMGVPIDTVYDTLAATLGSWAARARHCRTCSAARH